MSNVATLVTRSILLFSLAGWSSAAEHSPGNINVLPVVDKQDIRFVPITAGGESLDRWIRGIAQDDYGFLWFATNGGLFRYDGYRIKQFPHDSQNPNTVSDDDIRSVYKDRTGILWIGTLKGLDRLDLSRGAFTHYRHEQSVDTSLVWDMITRIYQDQSGTLWVGTQAGLDRLNPSNGTFAHYRHNPQDPTSLSSDWITALYEDSRGNFWVGTMAGLNKLDRATGRSEHFPHGRPNSRSLPGDFVGPIVEGPPGTLWIGSHGSWVSALELKTGEFTHYSYHSEQRGSDSNSGVVSMLPDSDGSLWLTTIESGVLKLDAGRREFSRYLAGQVTRIFKDAEGQVWIGTKAHGFMRFLRKPDPFVNYGTKVDSPKELLKGEIQSVGTDSQGFLWIGRANGLERLDRKTGRITLYQHTANNPYSLSEGPVFAMAEDHSGRLWFGSYGGGLNEFDRKTERFRVYRHDPNNPAGLGGDRILCMLVDHDGMLWLGLEGRGLDLYDPGTGKFTHYTHPDDPRGTTADYVTSVFEDRAGSLWVGAGGEIERFDRKSGRFTVYPNDPYALPVSIHEDRRGTLWVGTTTGLDRLDPSGKVKKFTTKDGLPGPYVKSILEDRHGDLWLATRKGLSHFSPETERFSNYFESDGLPSNLFDVLGKEASQTRTGEMVFGSPNGVTVFDPDQVAPNTYAPPVVLTEMLLFNQPVAGLGGKSPLEKPIWATNAITLHQDQSIFTLEFAALSYVDPQRNRYRYRMEQLETDWNEVDSTRRAATYTNLPPGNYVFRVQGSNNHLVWNETGVRLAVTVLPPWYGTWLFRIALLACVAGMIVISHKLRVRHFRTAAAQLERQVADRTIELAAAKESAESANRAKSAFLANMSHELRTPLSVILASSEFLNESDPTAEQRETIGAISRSGEHLLGMIDDVLDVAKIEAGKEELAIIASDLISTVRTVVEMMRGRAEEKHLALTYYQAPKVPRYVRVDAPKLRQILINLLSNAIKFTREGTVKLQLSAQPADEPGRARFCFDIEDSGVGMPQHDLGRIFEPFEQVRNPGPRAGTGLGLTITHRFVELMGGTLVVESEVGRGSRFVVELPLELATESETYDVELAPRRPFILDSGEPEWRILIVEDDSESAAVLRKMLTRSGFQVREAANGALGVEAFEQWRPHFIWMDLDLPQLSGPEATRRIRQLDGGPETKIAAITAASYASGRDGVMRAGFDDYTSKPFRQTEIFICMARHLGLRYSEGTGNKSHRQAGGRPA